MINFAQIGLIESEPKLRFGHSAVIFHHYLYVFGGWDGNITLSDLAVFDLELNLWL